MSRTIDNKVVEMEFDNANFERNVRTSMSTLDKLKQSLNFDGATRGLENVESVANNVSFDRMASGIEYLQNRFSTLGIVGMRVIQNLTDAAIRFATKGIGFVTEGITQGGIRRAMNLENAHFQLIGLLKDETKVAAVMEDVQNAVDGTAYGLDAAAKVASQLAASGMTAGNDMYKALRGIAGVAAMTNSDYESIGDIYTTIAGNGRIMGMQLTQLATRGLNAAATLGDALGVSEAAVRDMVSDGKIDFQTFANVMDDTFGEHAKAANETFTGSISNIKSALGRIGALFVTPIIEQNGPVVKLLNSIRVRINDIKKNLVPLADTFTAFVNGTALKFSNFLNNVKVDKSVTTLVHIFKGFGSTLSNVFSILLSGLIPIRNAFHETFSDTLLNVVVRFAQHLKYLTQNIKLSESTSLNLQKTASGFFSILKLGLIILKGVSQGIINIVSKLAGVPNDILSITGSVGEWINKTVDAIDSQNSFASAINFVSETIGNALSHIRDYLKECSLLDTIGQVISNVFNGIGKILTESGPKVKSFFQGLSSGIGSFFDNVQLGSSVMMTVLSVMIYNIRKAIVQVRKLMSLKSPYTAITDFLGQFKDTLFEWEKDINSNYFIKIGAALLMLATAFLVLSSIDGAKLGASFAVITGLMLELIGVLFILSKIDLSKSFALTRVSKVFVKFAAALLIMALALRVTASSLKAFSKIAEMDTAWEGFALMAASLGVLVVAMLALSKLSGKILVGAASMLIMAAAVTVLAIALGAFATVALLDSVWAGLGIMAISLGILVAALYGLSLMSPKIIVGAAAMLIMSAALGVLAVAIAAFATVALLDSVWAGLGIMAISLGVLVAALLGLSLMSPKIIVGAAAMLIMAAALNVLAIAIGSFAIVAGMDTVWAGIALMATSIGVLAIACLLLGKIAAPVLAGAATLLVMSAALGVFSLALGAVSSTIPLLVIALEALAPAIYSIATVIGNSIDYLMTSVGNGLAGVLDGVARGVQAIVASVGEGIGQGLTGISEGINDLSESIGGIGDGIEQFGNGVRSLDGISWTSTALGIAEISGALKKLNNNAFEGDTTNIDNYVLALSGLLQIIIDMNPEMSKHGKELSDSFGKSLTDGLVVYYSPLFSSGAYLVQGFINGINSKKAAAIAAVKSLGEATNSSLRSALQEHSPSKISTKIGEYYGEGYINGISSTIGTAEKVSTKLGKNSIQKLKDAISSATDMMDYNIDAQPVITPILDLSRVQSGSAALNAIMSKNKAMSIAADMNSVSEKNQNGSSSGSVYQFTQNNYSPKALSRIEIYRQTRNQFSALKGMTSV